MRTKRATLLAKPALLAAAAAFALWGAGCGDSPTAPTALAPGDGVCCDPRASTALTSELLSAIAVTLQDEYQAEAIYDRVLLDYGQDTRPFANVVNAEERHSAAIARLYANRSMDVPASQWNVDNVLRFGSVLEACTAGIDEERKNIAIYDEYQSLAMPADVARVFSSNRAASLERHLPAFEACRAALGG